MAQVGAHTLIGSVKTNTMEQDFALAEPIQKTAFYIGRFAFN